MLNGTSTYVGYGADDDRVDRHVCWWSEWERENEIHHAFKSRVAIVVADMFVTSSNIRRQHQRIIITRKTTREI